MAFHAFVNDAAEAGQTQISLSFGLVSGYGTAVPPMAADFAGFSTLVGRRCRSSSRHNCPIGVFVRHRRT